MIGRSHAESIVIAMDRLPAGYIEDIVIPWEPISRRPGDTTGGVVTDLPHSFKTEERNCFHHGTDLYALPSIREHNLKHSTEGKGMKLGERPRLYTMKFFREALVAALRESFPLRPRGSFRRR